MSLEAPSLLPPQSFLTSLAKSKAFSEKFGEDNFKNLDPQERRAYRARAVAATALSFAGRMSEASHLTPEQKLQMHQLKLLGTLEPFFQAHLQLQNAYERGLSREEIFNLKAQVIPFNHALKDMVDAYPTLTTSQVLQFTEGSQRTFHGDRAVNRCNEFVRDAMNGMQHEIGAEQILWNIDGVEDVLAQPIRGELETDAQYQARCIREETKGIDLRVLYRGRWIDVDIKATQKKANEANMRNAGYHHARPQLALWSQLTAEDFGGRFRIPESLAQRKAQQVELELAHAA